MDNNIEQLIKDSLYNNNNNKNNENNNNSTSTTPTLIEDNEDNSYEIEKLLQEIQNSCLSQYDKDKLLQSLYYCNGSENIEYYRQQLNNTIKDYNMENTIYKADLLLKQMNKNIQSKSNNLNKIENEITNIKSNLLHTTINKNEYSQVQIVFESTIEKIKSEFVKQRIQNTLK